MHCISLLGNVFNRFQENEYFVIEIPLFLSHVIGNKPDKYDAIPDVLLWHLCSWNYDLKISLTYVDT